jgi:hypothetical protein
VVGFVKSYLVIGIQSYRYICTVTYVTYSHENSKSYRNSCRNGEECAGAPHVVDDDVDAVDAGRHGQVLGHVRVEQGHFGQERADVGWRSGWSRCYKNFF